MCIVDIFATIKDIALAVAAGITAWVAYAGLGRWQKELNGKTNFDAAKALIKSVYKIREEFRCCRSPFILASEFPEDYIKNVLKASPKEKGDAYYYVYSNRWKPIAEACQEFDTAVLEAEALWGGAIRVKAKTFVSLINELRVTIDSVIGNEYSDNENFKSNKEFGNKMRSILNSSGDDEFLKRIEKAIHDLELDVSPHLSRK